MNDSQFSVHGKVTLVSGGSRGIGRALAAGFHQAGAQVVITGRDETTLSQAAAEIGSDGRKVEIEVCDVADVEAVRKGLQHKPFNPETDAHQSFLKSLKAKIAGLQERYPFMKFE